jgi:hypothetical protein
LKRSEVDNLLVEQVFSVEALVFHLSNSSSNSSKGGLKSAGFVDHVTIDEGIAQIDSPKREKEETVLKCFREEFSVLDAGRLVIL